jgi:hypothetical protein
MTSVWAAQLWLAAGSGTANNQPGGQGQEFGSSDPVALILIIALFVAVAFLIRSMSKHLKKVPASFDTDETAPPESSTGEAAPADGAEPTPDSGEVRHGG